MAFKVIGQRSRSYPSELQFSVNGIYPSTYSRPSVVRAAEVWAYRSTAWRRGSVVMPPPTIVGTIFAGCPSVRPCPLTSILRDAISSLRQWADLNESRRKHSSCQWALPKRLSRSEVNE